ACSSRRRRVGWKPWIPRREPRAVTFGSKRRDPRPLAGDFLHATAAILPRAGSPRLRAAVGPRRPAVSIQGRQVWQGGIEVRQRFARAGRRRDAGGNRRADGGAGQGTTQAVDEFRAGPAQGTWAGEAIADVEDGRQVDAAAVSGRLPPGAGGDRQAQWPRA